MKPAAKYDAIIIGGGHNGLVCAAYLAKAGQSVCVLERRHVLGGCATTEELWPGYKVSTAAYVISLFLPQIIRELKLQGVRPQDPAAQPVVVHAAARRPQPAAGPRRGAVPTARSPSSACATRRPIRATTRFSSASPRCSSRRSARPRPIRCRCPKTGGNIGLGKTAPRRQEAVGALPRARRARRRPARGGRAAHRRRPADSRSLVRERRAQGDAGHRRDHRRVHCRSARPAARTCCCTT